MQYLGFAMQVVSIFILLFSLIFLAGIVWRVEMKLDVAYKLFLAAIVFLLVSEIESMLAIEAFWLDVAGNASRLLFAVFFFWGVMEMRSLIRDVDGEKISS